MKVLVIRDTDGHFCAAHINDDILKWCSECLKKAFPSEAEDAMDCETNEEFVMQFTGRSSGGILDIVTVIDDVPQWNPFI